MRRTQNALGDFARHFESGVLDEKNHFNCATGFSSSSCFRAEGDSRGQFIPGTNSFQFCTRDRSGHGNIAPASTIPHRDSASFAATSERSASSFGKGKPYGRVGASRESRAVSDRRSGKFTCAVRKCAAKISNGGHIGCWVSDGAWRKRHPCAGRFSDNRYLGRDIGTGNDLKHRCWGIVNSADHHRWRQSLYEHLARWFVRACIFQRG